MPGKPLLFVEDEALLHLAMTPALEAAGYDVASVTGADEALVLLRRRAAEFCAIITDVDLGPGLTGWEIAALARQLVAEIPVVYATASAANDFLAHRVPMSMMVCKPYTGGELVAAVGTLEHAAGLLKH